MLEIEQTPVIANIQRIGFQVDRWNRAETTIQMYEFSQFEFEDSLQIGVQILEKYGSLSC